VIAWALLLGWPLSTLAATAECSQGLLQRLGWRFETAAITTPQVDGGPVCTRASLAEAQAAGDLRVRWPGTLAEADRQALLQQLLDDPLRRHCRTMNPSASPVCSWAG